MCVSFLDLTYTSWRLQCLDRRHKSLPAPPGRRGAASRATFLAWRGVSAAAQAASMVALALVLYAESFSGELSGDTSWDPALLALAPLALSLPLGAWAHAAHTRDGEGSNAYKLAHGFLSAIFPLR